MKILINSYNTVCQNKSGGVQVRIRNYNKYISNYAETKLFDPWIDKVDDYDILHVFKASVDSYALICAAKDKGKKVVISSVIPQEKALHIKYNLSIGKYLKMHTGYKMISEELDLADCIISQTVKEKKFINENYNISLEKIEVIPNGISINFDETNRCCISKQCGIEGKYVLQVGRFDPNKNQLSVIKALKGTGVKVVFIGGEDPEYKEYYQNCIDEGQEFCTFLGWQESGSAVMQSAYMNADVAILPSYKEIFGNSLIEAGAAGAKLLATNSLPVSDMGLSCYCTTFSPNDTQAIKEAILLALDKEKNPNQSSEIYKMFSWDNVAKRHYKVYERVLSECLNKR